MLIEDLLYLIILTHNCQISNHYDRCYNNFNWIVYEKMSIYFGGYDNCNLLFILLNVVDNATDRW